MGRPILSKESHFHTVISLPSRFRASTFSIHREWNLWEVPAPVIAECSFSPDSSPLVRVPKKSLFDPGGCPFTLFREKIGRDGKIFLRNFMDFAKKYFPGIKTERSWPTDAKLGKSPRFRDLETPIRTSLRAIRAKRDRLFRPVCLDFQEKVGPRSQ